MVKPNQYKRVSKKVGEKAEKDFERYEEFRKKQHDNYRQDRQFYVDSDERSSTLFDKSIITISSGAFGLTATLVSTVFKTPIHNSLNMVVCSLGYFGLSIFLIVTNYIVGHFAIERQIKLLDAHQEKVMNNPNLMGEKCPETCLRNVVLFLNIASLVSFGLGAFNFIKFVEANLGGS